MIRLTRPSLRWRESFLAGLGELLGSGSASSSTLALDFAEVERDLEGFVRGQLEKADPAFVPPGKVPETVFWIVDDEGFAGRVGVRHHLTDALRRWGGHIGYEVRPTRRRRGYAREALRLALDEARRLGLSAVLLTCDDTNEASWRTIEANGGVLEDVTTLEGREVPARRYWIAL